MLLHYSRTVLAAIIWTILLKSSAQERISDETGVRRIGKNVIGAYPEKLIDRVNDDGNMMEEGEKGGSNEEKLLEDGKNVRAFIKNGMVDYPVKNVVEKRHVRGKSLDAVRNNVRLEIENNEENVNDDPSIFQHHPDTFHDPLSLKENVVVASGIARDTNSLKEPRSNVSRAIMKMETKRKNDDKVARNGSTSKDIVDTEEALKPSRTFENPSSVSLIINSKASKGKHQMGNYKLGIHSDKHDYSTRGIVRKTRRNNDDSELMASASLNDNSSVKDKHIGKAIEFSNDRRSNKHGNMLTSDPREKFFYATKMKMEIGNYVNGEHRMEKMSGNNLNPDSEKLMTWEKENLDNIPRKVQEIIVTDRGSDAKEMVNEDIDKTRLSFRRDDLSRSKRLNIIGDKTKQEANDLAVKKQIFPRKNEDSGVYTFSMLSSSVEKKPKPITAPSRIDYTSVSFTVNDKMSADSSEIISGQIPKPRETPGRQEKMSLSAGNIEKGHEYLGPRDSLASSSYTRLLSEEQHLKNSQSTSLGTKNSDNQRDQEWNVEKINYPGKKREEDKSYLASSLNNESRDKSTKKSKIIGTNKVKRNLISWQRSFVDTRDKEKIPETTSSTKNINETSLSDWKFIDNSTNTNSRSRIHRNVIERTSENLQIDGEPHKSLIEENSVEGLEFRSVQEHQAGQEGKKQVEKLSSDMGYVKIDEIHGRENEASWQEGSRMNSEGSTSLWLGIKRENNVLDSNVRVTIGDTRKMELSKNEETRESTRIKNVGGGGDGGSGVERVIFSKETTRLIPRSMQFLQSTTMESNAPGNVSVIAENRENFIGTIYQTSRTDTLTPIDSPFVKIHPGDFHPVDDNEKDETEEHEEDDDHVRNGIGETSKVLGKTRSKLQQDKVFYQRLERDSQRDESLDIQEKPKVQSLPLAMLVSDASVPTETDSSFIDTVDFHPGNRKGGRVTQIDTIPDVTLVENSATAPSSEQRVTTLSNVPTDEIIPVTGYETLVKTTMKTRHDGRRANDLTQENSTWTSKIDETDDLLAGNRSKLRDSNRSTGKDSSEIQRDTRNHINDKISNSENCQACETVEMLVSSVNSEKIEKTVINDGERRENRVNIEDGTRKIGRSIIKVRETLKSTIHAEITRKNKTSVVSEFMADDRNSLGNTTDKLKTIDHTRPEEELGERMQWESVGMLVRGQEPINNAPKGRNLIVSGERGSALRRSSPNVVKLSDRPESAVRSDEKLERKNKRVKSFSTSGLDVESHEVSFRTPLPATSEKTDETITNSTEALAKEARKIFSDNADNVPRDSENVRSHASSQTINASDNGKRWKTLVHDYKTMSSMKIDSSIESIDRPTQFDRSARKKDLVENSQPDIHPGGTSVDILDPFNVRTKQIKGRFTRKDSVPFSIMETTPSHSHVYENITSTEILEVRDANLSGTMANNPATFELSRTTSRPIKTLKSFKSDTTNFNEISHISTINVTNVTSSSIMEVMSENPTFINRFDLSSAYNSLNKSDDSSSNIHPVIDELPSIPTVDPTNLNSPINDTGNFNLTHEDTFLVDNSTDKVSGESRRIVLAGNEETSREMFDNVRGLYDTRIHNQTMKDNSTRTTTTLNQWPVKHSAVVEGDLVLGGLMMVHEREDSVTCGPVMPQGGVQALEAMLYTLDWLNEQNLVPGVKIGAHILDDCDKDTYGLEMAVDFIKGSISNIDGAEYHCNKTAVRKVISGVVGAASSVTSIQVANLLRLFRIPQVSFFSTSPELSNKMRFEYFTRTIPSDHYQVKAMVDIVLAMGWSYVSIIYEESNYGEKAFEELEKLLGKHEICIAVKEKLSKDSGVAEAHVYDNIVVKLLTKPRARGCIIFGSDQEVAGVMRAVRRCNATGAFSWIGSDGWSARSLVSDGNEPEMEGTLSVQPQANPVEGFEDYFLNLTVENNRRNPWFVEFWEDHFKCRYPNASQTPYNNYTEECTTTERLTKQNTAFEDQLQFVSDAVLAFAYAFRNMHKDLCHGKSGLCDAMKPTKGTELLNYLRHVKFDGLSGDVFRFDKNGDGPARYNIIHFKQVSPGKYKWIRVGEYLEGELRLNMSEIQFRLGHPQAPESVCSLPCEVGQAKKYVEGESCCWHCFNCTQYQIRHVEDEEQCVLCPQGTVPDETHSYCRDIPEEFLRPESGWAIGAMSFSSTGILITLFVGGVFLKHNDTPIVRASGRELSYVLLTGILLCYLVTFALVLRPTDLVCSIQRFSAGFCFTVVYAALLTKTNRISRIFNAGKRSAKRPSFISPRSQLIICSMLVAIQILINAVWMVIDPAKARHHYPTREDNLLVCNSYIDASYMIAFTYPIILIVVCTVYAVLTRKIPEAFNESKHIGFTMYTTCVIWLAFVPLYFATGSHVALRITSMSVTISLSASVTIACLFTPKLYIILIHPERNVRPNMMHHRYNTTKASVVTATNASSMMAPVTLTAVTCDQNKAVKKHVITTMDCSTQSEQYEMEMKDRKNGKVPASLITRSTQTLLNNNGKDPSTLTSPVIKDIGIDENGTPIKILNIGKIGNGPLSPKEVPL